jgi:hypothetical protein
MFRDETRCAVSPGCARVAWTRLMVRATISGEPRAGRMQQHAVDGLDQEQVSCPLAVDTLASTRAVRLARCWPCWPSASVDPTEADPARGASRPCRPGMTAVTEAMPRLPTWVSWLTCIFTGSSKVPAVGKLRGRRARSAVPRLGYAPVRTLRCRPACRLLGGRDDLPGRAGQQLVLIRSPLFFSGSGKMQARRVFRGSPDASRYRAGGPCRRRRRHGPELRKLVQVGRV